MWKQIERQTSGAGLFSWRTLNALDVGGRAFLLYRQTDSKLGMMDGLST